MKIAFAGKGGVGKTTLAAWLGDYLARRGEDVCLVDADTALSLGSACGLAEAALPVPLAEREALVRERIGDGVYMQLTPQVDDLPAEVSVAVPVGRGPRYGPRLGRKRLLVMGGVAGGGTGCACGAGALLQAVMARVLSREDDAVLVDLEAGVEHLGRGTARDVDVLVVVSEQSRRALAVAGRVSAMARQLGLVRQVLVLTRCAPATGAAGGEPVLSGLPRVVVRVPVMAGLAARQAADGSVVSLPEIERVDAVCAALLAAVAKVEIGDSGVRPTGAVPAGRTPGAINA